MNKQGGNKKRYRAFYYSLAVCVVACFVAAFSIFGTSPAGDATSNIGTTKSDSEKEVAAPVTDVHDTRDKVTKPPEEIPSEATTQTSDAPETLEPSDADSELNDNIPYESTYVLPVSTNISKDYSNGEMVYSEINGDYRMHNGIDFAGKEGTPVGAIISGEVTAVIKDSKYGTIVEINHGNKLLARYCGIANVTVSKGDTVTQGQKIGEVGIVPVEGSTRHIHFETLIDGAYTDPLSVMGKAE